MLTNIKLSNFRIHKSTNINLSNRFVALVGKNDVGKSSVLEALDILCDSEKNIAADDQTKGSTAPANIEGTFDGITLDYSSPTINENRTAAKTIFQKFGVDDNNHFIDLNQDLNTLIDYCNTEFRLFIETTYTYHYERKKVEDLVNIFSILHKLYIDPLSSQPLKDVIDDFVAQNKNLQIIISNKETLFASNGNKDLLNNLFAILAPFETDFENAYLKGEDRINNTRFFEQRENRDLESFIIDQSLADISTKCNEILARFDQYSNLEKDKDIAYLWEQYLRRFGSNDIKLAKRGSGFKRLCEIYYFTMSNLAEYSIANGSTILAVEEPEISLHPSQQRDIVKRLNDILNLPNTQVIISTHSPYIVNELSIPSITVLKRKMDASGNYLDEIEPNPLKDRLLKKPLLCEINYLAFEAVSYDYHIALFGLMINLINAKIGFCDVENIDKKCFKNDPFKSLTTFQTYFRTGKDEELIVRKPAETDPLKRYVNDKYSLQYCVRNYIDHPHEINSDFGEMNIVETSIKQMFEIIAELKKLPD